MSQRKLQQDIDKLLKKSRDGIQEFNNIYDKFLASDVNNNSYREKLDNDLKREIKKLQKYREQFKIWLSKDDVKDKRSQLVDMREQIESKMDVFKNVDKQLKFKQFSKESLNNPNSNLNINEMELQKKNETTEFVENCLAELQKFLEIDEGLINDHQNNNTANIDVKEIESQIDKLNFHILNLENVLKLFQNNELSIEKFNEFRDDISYIVENFKEPDFIEYETIYKDMGCEINIDNTTTISSSSNNNNNNKKSTTSPTTSKNSSPKKLTKKTTMDNLSPIKKNSPTDSTGAENSKQMDGIDKVHDTDENETKLDFPKDLSDELHQIIKDDITTHHKAFNNPLFNDELKFWLNAKRPLLQPYKEMPNEMVQQLESSLLNCPDSLDADSPYLYKKPLSLPHPTSIFFPNEPIRFIYPLDDPGNNNANNNNDNTNSNNNNNNNSSNNNNNNNSTNISVNNTNTNDNDTTNISTNKITDNKLNDIYVNTSLARIFTKFDLDTLFFIFYHYQGTYEQFLAARELNGNRNWQFNKVDFCWYYKEIEKLPPGINNNNTKTNSNNRDLEEESWRYFDYRKSWLSRRCGNDFKYIESDFEKF